MCLTIHCFNYWAVDKLNYNTEFETFKVEWNECVTAEAPDSPCAPPPAALWATLRSTSTSSATTAKRALRAFRYGMYPVLICFYMLTKEQSFSLRSWSRRWLSEKKYELGRWRHSTEMKPNDWEKQQVSDLNLIFLGFKMKLFCSATNFWCYAERSSGADGTPVWQ